MGLSAEERNVRAEYRVLHPAAEVIRELFLRLVAWEDEV
jgi:hypothetical protein